MEKKNTLLLTVIAIATLLVAVVGATFAYFTSTTPTTANINTSVSTAAGTAAFTATSSKTDLDIVADSAWMVEANNNTERNQTGTITATLTGVSGSNETTTCTYKIKYTWTSAATEDVYYTPTPGNTKEMTIAVERTDGIDTAATGTDTAYTETNLDGTTPSYDLVTDGKIVSVNGAVVTDIWTVTYKFYNLNNQDALKGKTFSGNVELYNVNCSTALTA